jgi:polyisoprenyl-teichoic acid--peptidoglycan teichoic acid transferase
MQPTPINDTQPNRTRRTAAGSTLPIPRRLALGLGLALAVFTLVGGAVAYLAARDWATAWTVTGLNPFQPHASTLGGATPVPGATIPPEAAMTPVPWTGAERVTILLMGLDYRDWVSGVGFPRTDTMLLVTVDPITRQAGLMSIPRDLWVEIPGFPHQRINTAYPSGENNRVPGGGPGLAMRTVEDLLGVPIQYYAIVEFSAFERMIDEIGGIDVLVTERIKISPIGRTSIWLDPEGTHLDGAEALAYARVRKGAGDDFGRAERQQQVALAVIDRVLGFNMIPTLVTRAPALYAELQSGIQTNMTLDQMIAFGWLAVQIPKSDIHRGVIGPPKMVGFYTLPDGQKVIRPVPDQIRILRDEIFTATSGLGP